MRACPSVNAASVEDCEEIRFFFLLPTRATSSHSALPYVYQDRRFKFIPVAPQRWLRHGTAAACIVARLFGGSTGCNILRHRARSLEYRCPRFYGFSSAHGTRYFLRVPRPFLGRHVYFRSPTMVIPRSKFPSGCIRSHQKARNLEFDHIDTRGQHKHRNNLPNV